MFVKITTSGSRRYVQWVESFRDEGGRVKKRTLATLGRLDPLDGGLDTVINGLLKITGRPAVGSPPAPPTRNLRVVPDLWRGLGAHGAVERLGIFRCTGRVWQDPPSH